MSKKFSFEDKSDIIDLELKKRRNKWYLNSINHIDYDDVCQIIRRHIYKKWDLWDQEQQLEPWLNRVITNQIKNLTRNNYGNFARPCITCPMNEGKNGDIDLCGFTESGEQDTQCALFNKWKKAKQEAYNIKIPLAYDFHSHEVAFKNGQEFNLERSTERLNERMEVKLNNPKMFRVYRMLFIEKYSDEEVASFMGYKTTEKNRKAGYKQIRNLKIKFKVMAQKIIQDEDIIM